MWTLINNTYTASANEKLLIDTSIVPISVTLPNSPAPGASVLIADSNDFSINSVTVLSNIISFQNGSMNLNLHQKVQVMNLSIMDLHGMYLLLHYLVLKYQI